MSLSNATVTMNLSDMLGTDFDTRRTKVWVSTNVPGDTVIDTVGNAIRLGTGTVTLNTDGTASVAVWKPGTGSNPASWQTYIHVDYPDAGTRTRVVRDFGPFTLTADADLADLVAEQEVPPEYLTTVTTALSQFVTDAETAAAEAQDSAEAAAAAAAIANGVDLTENLGPFAAGKGIILTSPDGTVQRLFTIDNAGTLTGSDPAFGSGYQAEVLTDEPISYWRLGESSGTTATDETGAHDGTYAGGVTLGTAGLVGDSDTAVTLDGTNDHVVCNNGAIIAGLTNWSIEAVVKLSATGIVYGERGSSGMDILKIEAGGSGKIQLTYRDHAGTTNGFQSTNSLVTAGATHHIVVTKAGTTVKFYVDGTLDGTATLTASNTFGEATTQSWIGADPTGSGYFTGIIDEVAVYGHALTSGRINAHVGAMA